MITHSGDTSNLILDSDLDSYYLMDMTLLALPQTQDRLTTIITQVGGWSTCKRQSLSLKTGLLCRADDHAQSAGQFLTYKESPIFSFFNSALRMSKSVKEPNCLRFIVATLNLRYDWSSWLSCHAKRILRA